MQAVSTRYAKSIVQAIGRGTSVAYIGSGVEVTIQCEECDEPFKYLSPKNRIPPEAVSSKLARLGWQFGRHIKCPDHMRIKNHEIENFEETLKMVEAAATPALSVVPSGDARVARRQAMAWLEQAFDIESGRYSDGVTDASIAADCKLAESAIAKLREEFYGPIREPEELAEFRRQHDHLAGQIKKAEDLLKKLNVDLACLATNIATITSKNGWAS